MKITVNFGTMSVIVPCNEEKFTIRELSEKSLNKFLKLSHQHYKLDSSSSSNFGSTEMTESSGSLSQDLASITKTAAEVNNDKANEVNGCDTTITKPLRIESLTAGDGALFDMDDFVCDVIDDNDHIYAQLNRHPNFTGNMTLNGPHAYNHMAQGHRFPFSEYNRPDSMNSSYTPPTINGSLNITAPAFDNKSNNYGGSIYPNFNETQFMKSHFQDTHHRVAIDPENPIPGQVCSRDSGNNYHYKHPQVNTTSMNCTNPFYTDFVCPAKSDDTNEELTPFTFSSSPYDSADLVCGTSSVLSSYQATNSQSSSQNNPKSPAPINPPAEQDSCLVLPHKNQLFKSPAVDQSLSSEQIGITGSESIYIKDLKSFQTEMIKMQTSDDVPKTLINNKSDFKASMCEITESAKFSHTEQFDDGLIYSFPSFVSEIEITDDTSESSPLTSDLRIRRNSDPNMDYNSTISTTCSSSLNKYIDLKMLNRSHSEFTLRSNCLQHPITHAVANEDKSTSRECVNESSNLHSNNFCDISKQMNFYQNLLNLCRQASQMSLPSIDTSSNTFRSINLTNAYESPELGVPQTTFRIEVSDTNPTENGGKSLGIHVIPGYQSQEILDSNDLQDSKNHSPTPNKNKGLMVQKIEKDGLIRKATAQLMPGHLITHINGTDLDGKTFRDCLTILKDAILSNLLDIRYTDPLCDGGNPADSIPKNLTIAATVDRPSDFSNESLKNIPATLSVNTTFEESNFNPGHLNLGTTSTKPGDTQMSPCSISLHTFTIPLYRVVDRGDYFPENSTSIDAARDNGVIYPPNHKLLKDGTIVQLYNSLGVSVKGKTAVIHTTAPIQSKSKGILNQLPSIPNELKHSNENDGGTYVRFDTSNSKSSSSTAKSVNFDLQTSKPAENHVRERDLGIFVKSIIFQGAAYQDNRLKPEDQIVAINEENLLGVDNVSAMQRLKSFMKVLFDEMTAKADSKSESSFESPFINSDDHEKRNIQNSSLPTIHDSRLVTINITVLRKNTASPTLLKNDHSTLLQPNRLRTVPDRASNIITNVISPSARIIQSPTRDHQTAGMVAASLNNSFIKRASSLNALLATKSDVSQFGSSHGSHDTSYLSRMLLQIDEDTFIDYDNKHTMYHNSNNSGTGTDELNITPNSFNSPITARAKITNASPSFKSPNFNLNSSPTLANKFATKSPRARRLRNKVCNDSFRAALDLNFDVSKYRVPSGHFENGNIGSNGLLPQQPLYSEIIKKHKLTPLGEKDSNREISNLLNKSDSEGIYNNDQTLTNLITSSPSSNNQLDETIYNSPIWFIKPGKRNGYAVTGALKKEGDKQILTNGTRFNESFNQTDYETKEATNIASPATKKKFLFTKNKSSSSNKDYQTIEDVHNQSKFSLKNIGGFVLKKIKSETSHYRKPRSSSTHRNHKIKDPLGTPITYSSKAESGINYDISPTAATGEDTNIKLLRKISTTNSVNSFEFQSPVQSQSSVIRENGFYQNNLDKNHHDAAATQAQNRQISDDFCATPPPPPLKHSIHCNNVSMFGDSIDRLTYGSLIKRRPQSALYTDGPYLIENHKV